MRSLSLFLLLAFPVYAQDDTVPLKEWAVPFEQIRGTIAETHPLRVADLPGALQNLQNAMKSALTATYFITRDMKVDLQRQQLNGTVPILYVFLARSGKTVRDVSYVQLEPDGTIKPYEAAGPGAIRTWRRLRPT